MNGDAWSAVAAVAAVCAVVPSVVALVLARKATTIAEQAALDNKKLVQIEQAAEHDRLAPRRAFKLRGALPGGGLEYTLSVDRPVDSLTLVIVRDFDEAADSSVIGLTEATAPGPVGTLSSVLQLPAMPAGGARKVVLWTSDMERAAKATVRFRSEAHHGDRTWTDLIDDVVIPDLIPFKA